MRHLINVTTPVSRQKLGNSISTEYSVENGMVHIWWKGHLQSFESSTEQVWVDCCGHFPIVSAHQEPRHPIALEAWKQGFFRGMRQHDRESFSQVVRNETRYDRARDYEVSNAIAFTKEECGFAWRGVMDGQGWRPFAWFAFDDVSANIIKEQIHAAKCELFPWSTK